MTPPPSRHPERGVTLTELTVATVLASVVMIGLVGFYMSSQGVWLDSSSQAVTQREVTQLVTDLTERARGANQVVVTDVQGDSLQSVTFFVPTSAGTNTYHYWWSAGDQRVHFERDGSGDRGPLQVSQVERFRFVTNVDTSYVRFELRMCSPEDQHVGVTSGLYLPNNPPTQP